LATKHSEENTVEEGVTMRKIVPLCAVMLCALAIGLGCGDDKTTTITEYDTLIQTITQTDTVIDSVLPAVAATGAISPWDGFIFTSSMYYPTSARPVPDSVTVADSLCNLWQNGLPAPPGYADIYYSAEYISPQFMVQPGDSAVINYYYEGQLSTAKVKTLDPWFERPVFDTMDIPDTVDLDSAINLVWNKCTPADWYRIRVEWYPEVLLRAVPEEVYYLYTFDTTYTISGEYTADYGQYYFHIMALTGPVPDNTEGNITGGIVKGTILSYTESDYLNVRVGGEQEIPPPPSAPKVKPVVSKLSFDELGEELARTYHLPAPTMIR